MEKVLIAEDETIVANDIKKSLEDSGYEVSAIVSSGEEAVRNAHSIDIVLMDIVLEGEIDGITAAERIHNQADIPVVFLTAYADEEILKRAKMAEPYGYIVKPFDDRELHAVIEMALYRHELEKKVRESKKWLENKIKERSERLEILLNTSQSLQKEKNWENGIIIITECMINLGFEQCGIFLIHLMKKTLDYHYGKGSSLPEGLSLSLKDSEYFAVRCVLEKRTIHVKESTGEGKQLFESSSVVWVPIIIQNEVFAALGAANMQRLVTDEDVKDLEILAGMCGVFIDRTRVLVEPIPEKELETDITHWLDPAGGYIILEKEPEKSFQIFCDLVTHGIPGFVVSREFPDTIKRKYQLVKTPILWLSRFDVENTISPDSFSKLIYIIRDFTKKTKESVVLLDGLEYLISQTSFYEVLTYLQELKDIIFMSNSRLIIPLHKEVLTEKEYSILETEFTVLQQ